MKRVVGLVVFLLAIAVVAGVLVRSTRSEEGAAAVPQGWAPAPREVSGLEVLATADAGGLRLHTGGGDRTFLPGINLGGGLPGRLPGDFSSMDGAQFGGWLAQMRRLGIRVVRVYDLMPPAFYDALRYYNLNHETEPLYLVQGVRIPDTSYAEGESTLFDARIEDPFAAQILDVAAAVHGDLAYEKVDDQNPPVWESDVSDWLVAWVVGQEWDPAVVARTDAVQMPETPPGEYFTAADAATPTEHWLARQLNLLAGDLRERGESVPLSFVNGPTTDPLTRRGEPVTSADPASIDAEHVLPTGEWPGGTFASVHAYPEYPDFLRHETVLRQTEHDEQEDPYAGYLASLRSHFVSMPLVVAETGVSSSLGSAPDGPRERDHGGLDERTATSIAAGLLAVVHEAGASGVMLSSWIDDWSRPGWNTAPAQSPTGRYRWHDALNASEWFGILRHESGFVPDSLVSAALDGGTLSRATLQADAAYLRVLVRGRDSVPRRVVLDFDTVGDNAPERRVLLDTTSGTATALVRSAYDPIRLVAGEVVRLPDASQPWHVMRLVTRAATSSGAGPCR